MPVILALEKERQEDQKFRVNPSYTESEASQGYMSYEVLSPNPNKKKRE